jgi:hypothetical protein
MKNSTVLVGIILGALLRLSNAEASVASCTVKGYVQLDYVTSDWIEGRIGDDELIIRELEVYCIHCGAIQNYYSAGHYEREKWLKEAIEKDPEQAAALLAVRRLTDHNS